MAALTWPPPEITERTAPCAECGGTRLRKEARHVRVGGKSIVEVTALTVGELHERGLNERFAAYMRNWTGFVAG